MFDTELEKKERKRGVKRNMDEKGKVSKYERRVDPVMKKKRMETFRKIDEEGK